MRERRTRRGRWYRSSRAQILVPLLISVLVVAAAAVLLFPRPVSRVPVVRAAASEVLLTAMDIPQLGWGSWDSGTNGSGSWRLFAVHNELVLATLNVTLWVEADAEAARQAMDAIAHGLSYPLADGAVPGSDGSLFGSYSFGQYAGMVVRRYNVVFLLSAHLESSFALTQSDLARWSGWQLTKVEGFAA